MYCKRPETRSSTACVASRNLHSNIYYIIYIISPVEGELQRKRLHEKRVIRAVLFVRLHDEQYAASDRKDAVQYFDGEAVSRDGEMSLEPRVVRDTPVLRHAQ